jgi:orotate phosphoribosyltransferase
MVEVNMPVMTIQEDKAALLKLILKEAYFREKIMLSSGKMSDFYVDARRITLKPEGAFLTARIMLELVKDLSVDAIGGPTLGADPLVGAIGVLSFQQKKPINTFIIRKAPKPHGKQQQIEGPLLKDHARIILIDDVATTGKAFVESIDVLAKMNLKPLQCICIVDRQEGAQEALREKGCELVSIFKIGDIHKP